MPFLTRVAVPKLGGSTQALDKGGLKSLILALPKLV